MAGASFRRGQSFQHAPKAGRAHQVGGVDHLPELLGAELFRLAVLGDSDGKRESHKLWLEISTLVEIWAAI